MGNNEILNQMVAAIEEERKHEQHFFLTIAKNKTKAEKEEAGLFLSKVIVKKVYYSIGEWIEIIFERPKSFTSNHFKTGKGCLLNSQKNEEEYHATISYIGKNEIRVLLKTERLSLHEIEHDTSLSLEITYDERPYQVMKSTITNLLKDKRPEVVKWKKALYEGLELNEISESNKAVVNNLNTEQNNAINLSIKHDLLSIIHGPPGTGKTTTIVHLVDAIKSSKHKTLVCAPSNNAVDLLAKRLNERGIKVLRIGNITRIDDDIAHLSLDEKMRHHSEWNRIKKVKIEAAETHKKARQFKRNFGPKELAERKSLLKESRQLKKWGRELEERLEEIIIEETEVICTTLMGAALDILKDITFSLCIIDEASQALQPECWIPMLSSKKVILVGDHLQLPPTVKSSKAQELGLDITMLDLLTPTQSSCFLLQRQYRMNDDVLRFPNQYFYDGKLYGDEGVTKSKLRNDDGKVVFIDTAGCGFQEELNYKTRSLKNPNEYFILREHLLTISEKVMGEEIGIISPYAEQVRTIRMLIGEEKEFQKHDISINSIDGFQGQEKDVIYISLVRSNEQGEIGFLKDERRLNVAMTRAKKKLIIIGDSATIGQHKLYEKLLEHCEEYGIYKSAWEYMAYN